jgi:inhibitor of cysteine peptidase
MALGAALLVALAACGVPPPAPDEAAAPPGAPSRVLDLRSFRVELRQNETFEVRLPGNPTTGYRWVLVDPVPPFVLVRGVARFEPDAPGLMGSPGQERWEMSAIGAGEGPLQFEYRRAGDSASPPAQRVTYRLVVR